MGNRYHFKTFEEWCIENNRQDILDLWDYEKNELSPSEVPAGTKKKYYFKCPNGIHESELKRILTITDKPNHVVVCKQCGGPSCFMDLTGRQFGELTVLGLDGDRHNSAEKYWLCECSCGRKISVGGIKLRGGLKTACGKVGKHKSDLSSNEYDRKGHDYYAFRKGVIEKTNNICIISGLQLPDNEVHHIFPYAQYPDLRYDINNGVCIAKKYHSITVEGSFHRVYGTREKNTPENFEKYVNEKRIELGNYEYFDVMSYFYPYDEDNLPIDENYDYLYA